MPDLTAKRTLVKSPPELWDELSEVEGLMKHLAAFGEIKITKLEPEHTVAWEGEHGSGTVSIEPSGWGTTVTLHAELPEATEPEPEPVATEPEPEPVAIEPEPEPEPEPVASEPEPVAIEPEPVASEPEPEPVPPATRQSRGFWAWLFKTRTAEPVAIEPEPEAIEPEPEPVAVLPAPEPVTVEADAVVIEPEPEPEPEPDPESSPQTAGAEVADSEPALDPERARVILDEALDALGAAHHRPFSRG